jgi:hypothetical protein
VIKVADSSLAYDRTTKLPVHRLALTPLTRYALISSMYSVPRLADCRVESVEKFLQ